MSHGFEDSSKEVIDSISPFDICDDDNECDKVEINSEELLETLSIKCNQYFSKLKFYKEKNA